ncbi:uncharacterized protein EAE97_009069 [Botrytis byssoidea]|uniref:Heterokaryon incompatibility domain-containing protein n=1 Tax=Botrytis byssoidea TaxID=139641 RepID=A0A9P5I517_9HELO|nr:uncharacterized protein EAE97_009069 [Botrytis byssoidea]KAF7932048.1 hypothetical protein EAE97_009069 [Botrytis byssoidea]
MAKNITLFTFKQGTGVAAATPLNYDNFRGGRNRTEGAFRLIDVKGLTLRTPVLNIVEFSDIKFGQNAARELRKLPKSSIKYTAISHVWNPSPEVEHQMNAMNDKDLFGVEFDPPHGGTGLRLVNISWIGLNQMAHAAKMKGSNYIWLDLCCIDQPDRKDNETKFQISMMADIYRHANNVIVMVGGAGCVQHTDQVSPWMERAWTLQEAILNRKTFVCVLWPNLKRKVTYMSKGSPVVWTFQQVIAAKLAPKISSGDVCCLISLKDLLDMADVDSSLLKPSGCPEISVLDGMTLKAGNAPRLALRTAFLNSPLAIKYTGVWRSMFMRTSTKSIDVVYSIMGIFNLVIDPFKKNHDPSFMFNDLARKTGATPSIGAWGWLTIGGVTGGDIPFDGTSGIIPRFPHDEAKVAATTNQAPEMNFGGRWEWVGHHVDHSPFYITSPGSYSTSHNINFMTHSQPHIINATMIPVNHKPIVKGSRLVMTGGRKGVRRTVSMLKLMNSWGRCVHSGDLAGSWSQPGSIQAVFVGKVGDMSTAVEVAKPRYGYAGWMYFLFFKYSRSEKKWQIVANGAWNPPKGWKLPVSSRSIFNVGHHAQERLKKWSADDNLWVDQRYQLFRHSYGVEPLRGWLSDHPKERKIKWFGSKGSIPPMASDLVWRNFEFNYDLLKNFVPLMNKVNENDDDSDEEDHQDEAYIEKEENAPLDDLLKQGHIHHLRVLSCIVDENRTPRTSTTPTPYKILQQGSMPMTYSYGDWPKAVHIKLIKCNVEGLMIPNPWSNSEPVLKYQVRIVFGYRVMYVQMRHKGKSDPRFYNMYCVPYRAPGQSGPVRNRNSLISPQNSNYGPESYQLPVAY